MRVVRVKRTRMLSGVELKTKPAVRILGSFQRGVWWVHMVHIEFGKVLIP